MLSARTFLPSLSRSLACMRPSSSMYGLVRYSCGDVDGLVVCLVLRHRSVDEHLGPSIFLLMWGCFLHYGGHISCDTADYTGRFALEFILSQETHRHHKDLESFVVDLRDFLLGFISQPRI